MSARHASILAAARSVARRAAQVCGALVMASALGGCEQALSDEGGKSNMVFGLFKSKYGTTVRPELGGALKRESAFPAVQSPPKPSYPVIRNVSVDAPPPTGTLATERRDRPPAEAFIVDASAGRPAVALVNTYGDRHSAAFWEIDGKRFGKPRAATFDAAQPKWLMWSSEAVLALPAGRILFHLKYHDPRPKDAVFLYDAATDRARRLGEADPDWSRGLPFQYLDSLQVRPDVALARYSSEEERIGPQRYVNHFEHLLMFSPRHPDGLEIVTLGLDDGHVRHWGIVGNRLWLETADDRASPAGRFFWSLDLTPSFDSPQGGRGMPRRHQHMIDQDCLSPQEATYIAHNAYFTLKDWVSGQPTIGMETRGVVRKMVTGDGLGAAAQGGGVNTSLHGTGLAGAKLDRVFAGSTSGVSTGFGYVLSFNRDGRRHVVVATRGTRAEHSKADIFTDLRASMTPMAGIGPVHHGFRNTFDSVKIGLARDDRRIMDADVVHCVGHSLGGAVATLVATHFAGRGKAVKLYTFGSPRVGALGSSSAMEQVLGKQNIFRVAHDLDPVTMVGPYPFSHVNGLPTDENNMALVSPTGKLLSVANHDMSEYVRSIGSPGVSWNTVRLLSQAVDRDNAVLAKWLLRSSDNPGWVTQSAAQGLSYLMKAFNHLLKAAGYVGVQGLTAIDLFSATLANNLTRQATANPELMGWLKQAAGWARIVIVGVADITARVVRGILVAMMSVLRPLATLAIVNTAGRGMPLPLILGGATAVAGAVLG